MRWRGTAEGARPASPPATWVSTPDYPMAALMLGQHGRTRFRLVIDPSGMPMICSVMGSSGYPMLDTAACGALMHRVEFVPARGAQGCPVPASYTGSVVWQIQP